MCVCVDASRVQTASSDRVIVAGSFLARDIVADCCVQVRKRAPRFPDSRCTFCSASAFGDYYLRRVSFCFVF